MYNKTGMKNKILGSSTQILADVESQKSVSCIVDTAIGVAVGARKIAKAGTPVNINLMDRNTTPAVLATASVVMNAVLLHDVDVTDGNNNGTALIFGFVNVNRLEADVQALVTTATGATGVSPLLVFMK
jgi:uncharacterized ParB-like nuclease family protein